jgi:hypothetical protein
MPNPVGLGWFDWLGTGKTLNWRTFNKARAFVRKIGLQSRAEWEALCKSGKKSWIFRPVLKLSMPNPVGLAGLIGSALDASIGTIGKTSTKRVRSSASST